MGGSGKDPESSVVFALLFLGFLAFFVLSFLVWFVLDPERGQRVVSAFRGKVVLEPRIDEREWQLFFADPPPVGIEPPTVQSSSKRADSGSRV